jgi:tetratricopeptide (TPR) repeat protein
MKQHRSKAPPAAPPEAERVPVSPRHAAAMAIVLVALVAAAYSPCLQNDFVSWDDENNFVNNPSYRGLGWAQIAWDWTSFQVGVYQPLAWMLLGVQYLLFGLNPWGYHLASLILYALNTVVLFILTMALVIRARPDSPKEFSAGLVLAAGSAVALFAVHPLRTEVVAWASCQPYLPCALFAMLAVLAYLRAFPEGAPPRRGWLVAAFALFAAALCSKAVAVSLAVVFLILDVYPLRRLGGGPGRWFGPEVRAVWWEKVPFALLSVLFMGLAVSGRVQEHHLVAVENYGIGARIAQSCYGIAFYVLKTIVPWNITAYYPMPARVIWHERPFVACIAGTLAVTVALFLLRRRWPGLLAVWFSYVAILAPNLGLVRIGEQIAADRYSYIAMTGAVVLLAAGLARIGEVARRAWPIAAVCGALSLALLLGLMLLARGQCLIWRNSESLWTHALRHGASQSAVVHNNLGSTLLHQGRLEAARSEIAEALRLEPGYTEAHTNLGVVLFRQGRAEEAGNEFSRALGSNSTFADAHNNLGLLLKSQGRLAEAESEFSAALRLNPNSVEAHNNLGGLLASLGRPDEARAEFEAALRINPRSADAHSNLGALLNTQGRLAEAEAEFATALELNPRSADAHNNRGVLLGRQGRLEEARTDFAAAIELNPSFADPHYNLGLILMQQGQPEQARTELTAALRLKPGYAEAHNNLGVLHFQQGRLEEARAEFAAAVRINPAFRDAQNNLATVLRAQGQHEAAEARPGVAPK